MQIKEFGERSEFEFELNGDVPTPEVVMECVLKTMAAVKKMPMSYVIHVKDMIVVHPPRNKWKRPPILQKRTSVICGNRPLTTSTAYNLSILKERLKSDNYIQHLTMDGGNSEFVKFLSIAIHVFAVKPIQCE